MKNLVKNLNGNTLVIEIAERIFKKDAVLLACHKFMDKYHIQVEKKSDEVITVFLTPKQGNIDVDSVTSNFSNELLDQQVRLDTEKSCGNIRDLIVKQAFQPIENIQSEIKI